MVQERVSRRGNMADIGGGIGLPTMSQKEMFEQLLGDDESRSDSEPEIAAAIGEQMIHMDLRPLPRSIRKRLRDITGRIPARNVVIIGGGIGNIFDRIVYGSVTDFLYLNFGGIMKTGIFNIADLSVTTGMILILISSFKKTS